MNGNANGKANGNRNGHGHGAGGTDRKGGARAGGEGSYDVIVVGGGPAGLSAALTLGRARRSVLVVDAGQPRNAPADGVHAYLGREGTPPADLLSAGRAEVRAYGVEVREGVAVSAERAGGAGDDGPGSGTAGADGDAAGGFRVVLADGTSPRASRLLVTTGLVDELPEIPGLAGQWGRGVLHCPYCHGWEVRDQPIGVLGTGPLAVHQAQLWRQWSDDVTLFLHTGPEPSQEEYEQLAARGIAVVDGEVVCLATEPAAADARPSAGAGPSGDSAHVPDSGPAGDGSAGPEPAGRRSGRLSGVVLAGGRTVPVRALAVASRLTARSALLTALGLPVEDLEMAGHVVGTRIPADATTGATDLPGVWVAGNVTGPLDQVIAAAAAGVRAGAAINADIIGAEIRQAVAVRGQYGAAEGAGAR